MTSVLKFMWCMKGKEVFIVWLRPSYWNQMLREGEHCTLMLVINTTSIYCNESELIKIVFHYPTCICTASLYYFNSFPWKMINSFNSFLRKTIKINY